MQLPELEDRAARILIELDADDSHESLRRLAETWSPGGPRAWVAPDRVQLFRALRAGLPRDQAVLVPPGHDPRLRIPERRADARRQLNLSAAEFAVAVLPPIAHDPGAQDALWAGLLTQHLVPGLRVLLGDDSRAIRRLIRLAEACGQRHVLRWNHAAAELATLLAAADAAIFLSGGSASSQAAALALATGLPCIVSDFLSERLTRAAAAGTQSAADSPPRLFAPNLHEVPGRDIRGAATRLLRLAEAARSVQDETPAAAPPRSMTHDQQDSEGPIGWGEAVWPAAHFRQAYARQYARLLQEASSSTARIEP